MVGPGNPQTGNRRERKRGKEMIDFVNWLAYTVLWGLPLLVLMFGTGLYFTIRSGFFQFRHFGWIWRHTAGSLFRKDIHDSADAHRAGKLSAFEAICTAVGGTVGFGNIAGVATAVAAGGPGALMWMWICALLGMILKQVEVTLGVYYRGRNENGEYFGGPTYYMQKGLGVQRRWGGAWKILGVIFGAGIFSTFFVTSSNLTAAQVLAGATGVSSVSIGGMNVDMIILMGFVITVLTYIATTGGTRGIAQKFSRLVPFMSVAYLLMGLVMIAVNITRVPSAFVQIFHDAFTGTAVIGGFAGATVASIVRTGVARSVYSNEAGWGTSPMVHASAETPHPVEQGLWGSFEVFFDTIVVCTITGLAVVLSGCWTGGETGGTLALNSFASGFGVIGSVLLAVIMVIFTVTTSGGWFTYYIAILNHMGQSGNRFVAVLMKVFYALRGLPGILWTIYLVQTNNQGFIWTVVDITSAIPTFVNVFVILILSGEYFRLLRDYKARYMGIGTVREGERLFYEDDVQIEEENAA